jgi:hypothetical protein
MAVLVNVAGLVVFGTTFALLYGWALSWIERGELVATRASFGPGQDRESRPERRPPGRLLLVDRAWREHGVGTEHEGEQVVQSVRRVHRDLRA